MSADVHNLRGLMKKIVRLKDAMTQENYEKLRELNRKMDQILSK